MHWEQIDDNVFRSLIPGGWLVRYESNVMTLMHSDSLPSEGYEWRGSICFVPDPTHSWETNLWPV